MNTELSNQWKLENDFAEISKDGEKFFEQLKGAHIFLTGGTGFIGTWILEAIRFWNQTQKSNIRVTVLTRNPDSFKLKSLHLYETSAFDFLIGNIVNLPVQQLLARGPYTHLIHAATDASADLNENKPLQMFDTVVLGTRKVLDFAAQAKIQRVLYLSSGAVYGQQPPEIQHVSEQYMESNLALR